MDIGGSTCSIYRRKHLCIVTKQTAASQSKTLSKLCYHWYTILNPATKVPQAYYENVWNDANSGFMRSLLKRKRTIQRRHRLSLLRSKLRNARTFCMDEKIYRYSYINTYMWVMLRWVHRHTDNGDGQECWKWHKAYDAFSFWLQCNKRHWKPLNQGHEILFLFIFVLLFTCEGYTTAMVNVLEHM